MARQHQRGCFDLLLSFTKFTFTSHTHYCVTLEVCVNYHADPLAHLLSSKHETVPASAEYSDRIIRYPVFVFEAIIRALPNKVFDFGHTPTVQCSLLLWPHMHICSHASLQQDYEMFTQVSRDSGASFFWCFFRVILFTVACKLLVS